MLFMQSLSLSEIIVGKFRSILAESSIHDAVLCAADKGGHRQAARTKSGSYRYP